MSGQPPDYVQRTRQAWTRTGLSVVGVSAVVARLALLEHSWAALVVAAGALACSVGAVLARSVAATVAAVSCTAIAALTLILL